jgi:hypothetical protein
MTQPDIRNAALGFISGRLFARTARCSRIRAIKPLFVLLGVLVLSNGRAHAKGVDAQKLSLP